MKAASSKRQISSVTPFRKLVSVDMPSVDIKSDYDFTNNWSQRAVAENKKKQEHTVKVVSSIQTLLAQQVEIKKLQHKIKTLQYEKSLLVKWLHFLY